MGNNNSSPRNNNANRAQQQQAAAAAAAQAAQRRREQEAAAAAQARAEADRRRQEEEKRRRDEEEAARIKANTPFRKPTPPRLALTPRPNGSVNNMTITIAPGLSSSTVILSRDIIGKVSKTSTLIKPKEPMMIQPGIYAGTPWENAYTLNCLVPEDPSVSPFHPDPINPIIFISAFPDKDYPEVWVKGRHRLAISMFIFNHGLKVQQQTEYSGNKIKFQIASEIFVREQTKNEADQSIILWNPSETKGENGAVAINYKTHGALTKVFLKPTIPFEIGYAPLPLIAPRPPASK